MFNIRVYKGDFTSQLPISDETELDGGKDLLWLTV